MTIAGALKYQACDDRLCFIPRSVPATHVLKLRRLGTERANAPEQRTH